MDRGEREFNLGVGVICPALHGCLACQRRDVVVSLHSILGRPSITRHDPDVLLFLPQDAPHGYQASLDDFGRIGRISPPQQYGHYWATNGQCRSSAADETSPTAQREKQRAASLLYLFHQGPQFAARSSHSAGTPAVNLGRRSRRCGNIISLLLHSSHGLHYVLVCLQIKKCPTLIQEMVVCVSQLIMLAHAGRLSRMPSLVTLEGCMKLSAMVVQALWECKSPLLQLPHITDDNLKYFSSKRHQVLGRNQ